MLRQLRPEPVYLHDVNVVVLLTSTPGEEHGLYICLPEASMMPSSGTNGFTFASLGLHLCQFERALKAAIYRSAVSGQSIRLL